MDEEELAGKTPIQFEVGDVIIDRHQTPYSGSPMKQIEDIGEGRTRVSFENGEVVDFFNGFVHQMQE